MITKLTKGQQITLSSAIREKLNLQPGSRVEVELQGHEAVIRPIGTDLKQFFQQSKKIKAKMNLTAEQMDQVVEEEIH